MTQPAALGPAAEEFVERLGVALEFFGLSRTAGRILAYLIFHDGPASFDDLTTALKVSRGSVSTNTRHLERLGVIERRSKPGERGDYFALTPDSQARFLEAWFTRIADIESIIKDTLVSLDDGDPVARKRIGYTEEFYRYVHDRMTACVRDWDERAETRRRRS